MKNIPLSVPNINGNEWVYIKECLDTGWVSSAGSYVSQFEELIGKFTGASHAVACVNGTSALQIALQLVGVRPGDEVIAPSLTFIATINAIHHVGAHPIFVDSDCFYNISAPQILEFLNENTTFDGTETRNRHSGRRISAVLPVHVFGNAANLDDLVPECKARKVAVVEDAAESLGTKYTQGRFAGRHTGTIGDIGCISFNGNKIITTGGGGMILTNKRSYADRARYLTTQAKDDPVHYIHNEAGYNFRMNNIQAALGVAQLEKLPDFLRVKAENFLRYQKGVADTTGLTLIAPPDYAENNLWMYALRIDSNKYGRDREMTMQHLNSLGIQSRPVWHLNHLQEPYKNAQCIGASNAANLVANTLNIPCGSSLSPSDVDYVVKALRNG